MWGTPGAQEPSLLVDGGGVVSAAMGVNAADDNASPLAMLVPPFRSGTSQDRHAPAGRGGHQ